jgi:hypothetical protein
MEAWTADGEFVGAYTTRQEAAAALWRVLARKNPWQRRVDKQP